MSVLSDIRRLLPPGYTVEFGAPTRGVYVRDAQGQRVRGADGRLLLLQTRGDSKGNAVRAMLRQAGLTGGGS